MSDDQSTSRSRFGLDKLRDGVQNKTDELSADANARSVSGSDVARDKPFTFEQEDYDRTEAPKDEMRRYWRQFETTPIIRKPITAFASRVTEPGYYIESEQLDRDEIQALGEWLDQCAIIEGQPGKDFRLLAKKAIIQREVRGTALVEKAPHKEDDDKIAGLKLLNPETVEAVTHPHQSILLAPDDIEEYEDAPEAESGGAAAWLQDTLETDQALFGRDYTDDDDTKIGFRRDEIIPLTRDADVGEVFGTSRLEAVSDRIEGLKNKLNDNDEAIASKAYPLWLFLFGDPDSETGVWSSDDINDFMEAQEMENFQPGQKQGVRGDVSVETISGEVADIAEYLRFDIEWAMASMPMPMFLLGSFNQSSVGQIAGIAQQQDVIRQIAEARRELEEEFTPLLREIAQQKGINEDKVTDIKLRFGNPNQPDPEVARSQQTIRYISDADGGSTSGRQQQQRQPQQPAVGQQPGQQPTGRPQGQPSGQQQGRATDTNPFADIAGGERETQQLGGRYGQVWDEQAAELSALRREAVSNEADPDEALDEAIEQVFLHLRDRTLDRIAGAYQTSPQAAVTEFENVANQMLNRVIRASNVRQLAETQFRATADQLADTDTDTGEFAGFTQREAVTYFAQNVRNAVRDAGEELLRRARKLVRDGVTSDDSWPNVRERIEQVYDDRTLAQRAQLIAHMEHHNAAETMKLQQFKAAPDIVGVRAHNPDASTDLTQALHDTTAYFSEGPISEQFAAVLGDTPRPDGFHPLPETPPYHFNDTTVLKPVYDDEVNT